MSKKHSGFTLIELLMTMVIAGIMATMAIPAMTSFLSSSRVAGLTERIQADIELARTQTVLNGSNDVELRITPGAAWCYGLDDDFSDACNCNNPATCTIDGSQKVINFNSYTNTTVAISFPAGIYTFSGTGRPNVLQNTITLTDGSVNTTVTLTPLSRANVCSDDLPQYNTCN